MIVDELGWLPFEPNAAHLVLRLVSPRGEQGSRLITANRPVGAWGTVRGDPVVRPPGSTGSGTTGPVFTSRGDTDRLREQPRSGLITASPLDHEQAA